MDPKEIQKMIADAIAAATKPLTDQIAGMSSAIESAGTIKTELEGMKRQALVTERLSACKLAPEDTTPALLKYLASCTESAEMDTAIRGHKEVIGKHIVTPVPNPAPTGVTTMEFRGLDSVLESVGFASAKTAADYRSAADKFLKTPHGMACYSPAMEGYEKPGQWSFQHRNDPAVAKLRKEVIESFTLHGIARRCFGKVPRSDMELSAVFEDAVTTAGFNVINTALLAAIVIDAFDVVGEESNQADFLSTNWDSTLKTEVIPGYTSTSGMTAQVNEGDIAPVITFGQKGVQANLPPKIWGAMVITRDEFLQDQKGLVIARGNLIAEQARVIRDLTRLLNLTDQSNYTVAEVAGKTDWRNFRPMVVAGGNATYAVANQFNASNTVYSNPLTDYTNVQKAVALLKAQTDESGRRLMLNASRPLTVLIPDTVMEFDAWHVFNAFGTQLRTNNMANIMQGANPFANTTIRRSATLATIQDTLNPGGVNAGGAVDPIGTWYIAGAAGFQRQYKNKRYIPFECPQIPPDEIQRVMRDLICGVRPSFAEMIVPVVNKFVIKCVPTPAPTS